MQSSANMGSVTSRILDIEVQEGDDPMGQNVSAALRIEAYLMTLVVRYMLDWEGIDRPEFCINGVWYQSYLYLDTLRDVNEPYHNLHCLVIKDESKARLSGWEGLDDCICIASLYNQLVRRRGSSNDTAALNSWVNIMSCCRGVT